MMLLRKKTLLCVLSVLAIVVLMTTVPLFAATEEVEIAGTVFASEWDANDNVTAVVIATEEGEEIAVATSGKGMELLKLEEKNVKVTGSVVTDEEGRKTVNITKYIIQE
ncbi:MAG: hypothetical protein PVH35_00235 [Syntrophobacterales bacterium]|jgi:hypothetical protein